MTLDHIGTRSDGYKMGTKFASLLTTHAFQVVWKVRPGSAPVKSQKPPAQSWNWQILDHNLAECALQERYVT
jgi:hypothetical protein